MQEKIDGCFQLGAKNPIFCKDCPNAPAKSTLCDAFRAINIRLCFEDER